MLKNLDLNGIKTCILYGGVFDPPHLGHVQCLLRAQTAFPKALILLSPTPISPESYKDLPAPYEDRINLCRLQFGKIPRVIVSDFERTLDPPYYTYKTLSHLKSLLNVPLGLLLGEDQFWNLPNWKHPEIVLSLAQMIIIPRSTLGSTQPHSALQSKLSQVSAADFLKNLLNETIKSHKDFLPPCVLAGTAHPASSTEIRSALKNTEENHLAEWLGPEVLTYIKDHQLYRGHNGYS